MLAYICNRSVQNANEIMFFEVYKDQAALDAHGKTPHLANISAKRAEYFSSPMEISPYQQVAGYHR